MDLASIFPESRPEIIAIATHLQTLVMTVFPDAVVSSDDENAGYGFGKGYKNLVFVISPHPEHVNLGIANGAKLADPKRLMQGSGRVHRHVKLRKVEQVDDPNLRRLMLVALQAARARLHEGA